MNSIEWDAFVSHASEDKSMFVVPLVDELRKYGLRVWFDASSLKVGDSLRESIDRGLGKSEYGIVVLSHSFFTKDWPSKELSALFARQVGGKKVILPVWYDISHEELLTYSPLLADVVACKSSDGIPAVARALVGVIRPGAFLLHTSISDSQHSVERMREQLRANNPSLDCRVTFDSELSPAAVGAADEPGLVASVATDGLRMDFFAKNAAMYNQKPLSYELGLTRQAWSKIQEGLRSGNIVKLSEEHLHGVSPELTWFGFDPAMFTNVKSLVLAPRSELLNRTFRFRVRFANGGEIEEFSYVGFKIVRAGSGELEIASTGSQLPLKLTLTVHVDDTPPGQRAMNAAVEFGWSLSYEGHSIRKLYRVQKALKFLREGGALELFDLEQDKVFASFSQPKQTSGPDAEFMSKLDRFITDLHAIAEATKSEIIWKGDISQDDAVHTGMLHQVIATGRVSIPDATIDVTLEASQHGKIQAGLEQGSHGFTCRFSGPPDFGSVFGQAIDLGEYCVLLRPTEVEASPIADNLVHVKIKGEVTFVFNRFARNEDCHA
jgi:TIR domain